MLTPLPSPSRSWVAHAVDVLSEDARAQRTTPLIDIPLPGEWGVEIIAKDERVHPTGSLKHRLARSLFLHAVVDGEIGPNTTIIEASSGSTAISEAYFARELGLPFIAVVPEGTSPHKISLIRSFGGVVRYVSDASEASATSRAIAAERGGHFMDQFTNASRVTDWKGDAGLAGELFGQLADRGQPLPSWVVVGAGTGGTSAMLGRYCRSRHLKTRIALADPENSAYFGRIARMHSPTSVSRIEGIGRTVVEPSFVPAVIDSAFRVDDAQSVAAMELFREMTGQACGPSTGTNLVVALYVALAMRARGERGTVATIICDGADRYSDTFYSQEWLSANGMDPSPYAQPLRTALLTGVWSDALSPVATPDWSAVN
jgi:cysteine synthase A